MTFANQHIYDASHHRQTGAAWASFENSSPFSGDGETLFMRLTAAYLGLTATFRPTRP